MLALAPFATSLPVQKDTQVLAVTVKSLEDAFSPIEVIPSDNAPQVTIHTRDLPKTESGQGLIRMIVNDGLNTTYQDVGGLSIRG